MTEKSKNNKRRQQLKLNLPWSDLHPDSLMFGVHNDIGVSQQRARLTVEIWQFDLGESYLHLSMETRLSLELYDSRGQQYSRTNRADPELQGNVYLGSSPAFLSRRSRILKPRSVAAFCISKYLTNYSKHFGAASPNDYW
jgi:hypothetical protein